VAPIQGCDVSTPGNSAHTAAGATVTAYTSCFRVRWSHHGDQLRRGIVSKRNFWGNFRSKYYRRSVELGVILNPHSYWSLSLLSLSHWNGISNIHYQTLQT